MRWLCVLLLGLSLPLLAQAAALPAKPDRLAVTDVVVGRGIVAKPGMRVAVLYSAWFYDAAKPEGRGKQFDGTRNYTPFEFTMDDPRLIKGWREGMAGMRVGGEREIVIPADLAYGAKGKGIVPPNMPLVFNIRLLDAHAP